MNRALLNTAPWRLLVLTAATVPLTVWAGDRWGGTGGAVTLAAVMVPVACASLSGQLGGALIAALLASVGICVEAAFSGGPDGGSGLRFASVASVAMLAMATIVATTIRLLRNQLARHREELRDSSDEWDTLAPPTVQEPDPAFIAAACPPAGQNDHDSTAMLSLLLTLQDIGRRVSMNLDLDTLIPAVTSTARTALDCTHCEVYLWDRARQHLVSPLADSTTAAGAIVPHSAAEMARRAIRERQVILGGPLIQDDEPRPQAIAPLMVGNDVLGVLVLDGLAQVSSDLPQRLHTLASIYAMGIKNAQLFRRVEEMALRDGLTGLYNHATFQRRLRGIRRDALVSETQFALVMSDADHFKRINDTFGHQAGDEVLRELARLWQAAMPDSAVLARYGGEEFIAAIPRANLQQATELAQFLCETIADHPFSYEGRQLRVTASFGVSEYRGADQTADDIVREADEHLFAAKNSGRNRVVSRTRTPLIPLRRPSPA